MNSLLAKNQPVPEYTGPTTEEQAYNQRLLDLDISSGKYTLRQGAGRSRQIVETGPVAPEAVGDSREARAERRVWIDALIERIRTQAQAEKMLFQVGSGFSSLAREDYR